MAIKLLSSEYDNINKSSKVVIKTELGYFCGLSYLHSEDADLESSFVGCEYAEAKAIIKYEKAKLTIYKQKMNYLHTLNLDLEKLNGYQKYSREARYIRKQYFLARAAVQKQQEKIKAMKDNLYQEMKNYRKTKEEYDKKITMFRQKRKNKQGE